MPRFYLNIEKSGIFIEDPEGDELPSLEAARELALETLREMHRLPHVYGERDEWEDRRFIITNENGKRLLTIPFDDAAEGGTRA
jgi:hypothetical protein